MIIRKVTISPDDKEFLPYINVWEFAGWFWMTHNLFSPSFWPHWWVMYRGARWWALRWHVSHLVHPLYSKRAMNEKLDMLGATL